MKWRQGRKVPIHVYEQKGPEPSDAPQPNGDRPVATFLTERDAQMACFAVDVVARIDKNLRDEDSTVLRLPREVVTLLRTLASLEVRSLRGRTVHDPMMVEVKNKQVAALEDFLFRSQPLEQPVEPVSAAQVP